MLFLRLSAAFLRKWDPVASGPFHSCHASPFVIDLDRTPDAAFATQPESVFIQSAHYELLRTASQHMQRIAGEHLLHPRNAADSGPLSIGDS